jgi:hypothetical protein
MRAAIALSFFASAAVMSFAATSASAEEGMWTYDNFPIARANQQLGTNIDQGFLDTLRLSSVKFGGCSAGVISAEGLVMTNNHCVATCVANLSTPQLQYAETGFLPKSREEELKCPGGTAEIVTDISDVTARINKASEGLEGQAFTRARETEAARIESETCGNDPKVRCQVVSLYRGGQFKLYQFRKYDDVRLAWAPEDRAATFGGDLDNFSFPRYAIDAAFIRLYEDGKPVQTPTHFKWNAERPTEGEAIFLSGNPGSTQRLLTQAQLMTIRDVVLPMDQLIASELRGRLIRFSEEGEEQAFIAMDPIVGVENTYKRGRGRMAALIDPGFMGVKAAAEADFRQKASSDQPWTTLEAVQPIARELYAPMALLEGGTGMGTTSVAGGSNLFGWARTLVRAAEERAKPSDQRLPEYSDSRISAVQSRLLADRPTYPALEQIRLEWWLSKTREWLTVDNQYMAALLGKESPEGLSARVVEGTKLADPAMRRALWEGGLEAIQASNDPMIQYALRIDADARAVRTDWENRVQAPTDKASEQLAAARFAVYGDAVYPDATGTLRLTYGKIEGSDVPGQRFGPFTTFSGLWDRATGAEPFVTTPGLQAAKDRLDPNAVVNMTVSTDTIGGSSGSPVVNAKGEIIGANFDSTVLTQRNAYGYDRTTNRSVIVTTQAVTAAIRDVYGLTHLVEELGVK